MKAEIFNCQYEFLTEELIKRAHESGLLVTAWVVNEPAEIKKLLSFGVDGITTDNPDAARRLIEVG